MKLKDVLAGLASFAVIWFFTSLYVFALEKRVAALEGERAINEALEGLEWI